MRHQIRLVFALLALISMWNVKELVWHSLSEQERSEAQIETKASIAGMTTEEFALMSAIVEAESDRNPDHVEGKKLIALTILNRVESDQFPNTITGVISESGQFQVYYEGTYRSIGRTEESDEAVIEASFWAKKEHPNVIFFNSIGFDGLGQAYEYVEGNYFETLEET